MFKRVKVKTVSEYLKAVPKERQEIVDFIHKFIQATAPKLKPHFAYNMLGYGTFEYRNHAGKIMDWPIIALANQKNYVSVYVCAVESGKYVAELNAKDLGKVSVGKSCIRFKKLEDLNLKVFKKVIQQAAKKPGLR